MMVLLLKSCVWQGTAYEQSEDVVSCDYFVSHSWKDDGGCKVAILREFLCLQAFLGRLLVICPMLALAMAAPGFALSSMADHLPWWTISAVPMTVMLMLLLWVAVSVFGGLPSSYTPWAFSSGKLWIGAAFVLEPCVLEPGARSRVRL